QPRRPAQALPPEPGGARGTDRLDRHVSSGRGAAIPSARRRPRRHEGAGEMNDRPTTITAEPGSPIIDIIRDFDPPPPQLFRAATDPELVAQWLGPREYEMQVIEYDARPGGSYHYVHRAPRGEEYGFRGVFHTVIANERITQTFEHDQAPGVVSLDSTTYEDI